MDRPRAKSCCRGGGGLIAGLYQPLWTSVVLRTCRVLRGGADVLAPALLVGGQRLPLLDGI